MGWCMWGEGEGVVCVGSVVCRGNVVWVEWGVGGNVVCVSGRVVGVSGVPHCARFKYFFQKLFDWSNCFYSTASYATRTVLLILGYFGSF